MAKKKPGMDLPDSERDKEHLQPEETTIDLPDVKDIPGQENIRVPKLREMADTTVSSDDEEGTGIWDKDESGEDLTNEVFGPAHLLTATDLAANDNNRKLESRLDKEDLSSDIEKEDDLGITDDSVDPDSDVRQDEKELLERSADNVDTPDNENLFRSELDDTDFDGEKLNEEIGITGRDLDVPGAEEDDANEEIGEEDEENNAYSLGDTE